MTMRNLCVLCVLCVLCGFSGSASADDGTAVVVRHVPPAEAPEREPLRLAALVDNAYLEAALVVRYRAAGSAEAFVEAPFERSSTGAYFAVIPAAAVGRPGVEYYLVGIGKDGGERAHFASAKQPHEVRVEPATQLRWIEAERRRLRGHVDFAHLELTLSSFGDEVQGLNDYFGRGEVSWTHRQVTALYSFTLGFGFLEGHTPVRDPSSPDDFLDAKHGVRYGFGGVRVRMHESVWLDGTVLLGFSQDGFAAGVRGVMIFGRPWRSCVHVGAEAIQDTGTNVWLKLQWDTVPPFMLSAQVALTSMPDSEFHAVLMSFNVDYPVSPGFTVGAGLTGSARHNRSTYPGASLNASMEF